MTVDELSTVIAENSLCIRRIPEVIVSLWTFNPKTVRPNEVIVEKNGRKYVEETRRPSNGGKWLVMREHSSSDTVKWYRNDPVKPWTNRGYVEGNTLEEAVLNWLKANQKKE